MNFEFLKPLSLCFLTIWVTVSVSAQRHDDPATDTLNYLYSKWVSPEGLVNYQGFQQDSAVFYRYLSQLDSARGRSLAFYINAYNALVIKSVIEDSALLYNPYRSASVVQVPGFYDSTHTVAGRAMSLADLERYLLATYRDARVLLTLGRGYRSSSPLRNKAYENATIEKDLAEVTTAFVNSDLGLTIDDNGFKVEMNPLFKQFENEFKRGYASVLVFIRKQVTVRSKISQIETAYKQKFDITYQRTNWDLNRQ